MSDIYLFALASKNAEWLQERQALVSSNVANANTPGYRAVDLQPFAKFLNLDGSDLTSTNPAHFQLAKLGSTFARPVENDATDAALSGNSVSLEQEMVKLGEINRSLSLNTNIRRVFHQMIMSTLK